MKIDTQLSNLQTSKPQVNNYSQQQSNNETGNAETNTHDSVNLSLSARGQARSFSAASNNIDTTKIVNVSEAQEVVNQLEQTAANDPVSAEQAQSNHVTSDLVKHLIG